MSGAGAGSGRPTDVSVSILAAEAGDEAGGEELAERVLALVRAARARIWILAYTLSDRDLLALLEERADEDGLDLRVLVDAEQHDKALKRSGGEPWGETLRALEADGRLVPVAVAGPEGDGRLHTKLIVLDDRVVIAGSKNWSDLDASTKWNDLAVLDGPRGGVVETCRDAFTRIASEAAGEKVDLGKPLRDAEPLAPLEEANGGEPGRALIRFADPRAGSGAEMRRALIDRLRGAKTRILGAVNILNDPEISLILAAQAKRKRVEVALTLDRVQFENLERRRDAEAKRLLDTLGALRRSGHLRISKKGDPQLHHKLVVIDDAVVTGSANWTKAAFGKNRELTLTLLPPKRSKEEPAFVTRYVERARAIWERSE